MYKITSVLTVVGLCLAACGGDDDDDDDVPDGAPAPDATSPDATAPDAEPPTGLVTVTVYDQNNQLEPGADVIVQHADGTVASTTQTDENGQSTPTVIAGDMVTVAQSFASKGTIYTLMTWTAVEPGDHLTRGTGRGDGSSFGNVTVTTPGGLKGAGIYVATSAQHFFGFDSCFDRADSTQPSPALSYELNASCHADQSKVPVLLLAQDETQRSLAYAASPGVTLTGGEAEVTFVDWRDDFLPFTSTVTNLPGAASVERHLALRAATGELFELDLDVDTTPGSAIADVPMDLAQSWFYADGIRENESQRWRLVSGPMPIPTALSLDHATDLLAGIDSLGFTAGADVARFETTWAYQGNGDTVSRDAVLVEHELDLDAGFGFWTFVVPPDVRTLKLPALPEALAEFRPTATPRFGTVMTIETSGGGYDEVRQAVNGSLDPLGQPATTPPPGVTVRVSRQGFFLDNE